MFLERFRKTHIPPAEFCAWTAIPERCTGCGLCVQTCPGNLLELVDKRPRVKTTYKVGDLEFKVGCVGCYNCFSVCPEDAIRITGRYRVTQGLYKTLTNPPSFPNPFREKEPRPFAEIEKDLTETEKVIYKRRSNRLYHQKKQVPPELVHRVLEAGRFAPSAGNTLPYKYIVIQDRALIDEMTREIVPILRRFNKIYLGRRLWNKILVWILAQVAPEGMDQRIHAGIYTVANLPGREVFHHAPTVILIAGDKRGASDYRVDCAITAQNMMLTAHALGLASCFIGYSTALNFNGKMKKKLNIRWPYKIVTSIILGYPKIPSDKVVARDMPPVEWHSPK